MNDETVLCFHIPRVLQTEEILKNNREWFYFETEKEAEHFFSSYGFDYNKIDKNY